jgi:hypothetical protein
MFCFRLCLFYKLNVDYVFYLVVMDEMMSV